MWRPGRSQKRDLRFASTASDRTASGVTGLCAGDRPLRLLGHEADRPHPAGELARRGDVRLAAVDPAREQRLPPLDQPPHALGGMPPGAPVRGLALGEVLRPPRVSVNLFFTSFAKQARRSRKGGFTGCANAFSPIPVTT